MVAAGNQRGARRTAKRCRVEMVVAQPLRGKLVHRRRRNAAAESTELAEAAVIDQDQQNIRRSLGGLHRFWKLRGIGLDIGAADLAGKMKIRARQYVWRASILTWPVFRL